MSTIAPPADSAPPEPQAPLNTGMQPHFHSGDASNLHAGQSVPRERGEGTEQGGLVSDLVQLTKPRIVVMILFTTIATSLIAAESWIDLESLFCLLLGTGLIAGSAGAANQIWERVIDGQMSRTAKRPLPDGRLNVTVALFFTGMTGIVGSAVLSTRFGPVPAAAGVATWLIYVLVYTPMKTRTAWNTTVGAIAGALPVLIGYTATGGSLSDATGWLLFGVLAAWQYPHFMAIAWMYRRQYADAGFRMTTTADPSGRWAGYQAIGGSLLLMVCGFALCAIPNGMFAGMLCCLAVFGASYPMLKASVRFTREPDDKLARKLLRSSLLVLPAVLFVVTLRVFW